MIQDGMERSRKENELSAEDRKRISIRESELLSYRELIEQQEKEINSYRSKMKKEYLEREKEFQRELEAREKFFVEREKQLFERKMEFENNLAKRTAEAEALRNRLEHEISIREINLQSARLELEQEKARYNEESRKKIEETSRDYVTDALDTLDKKEKQFHLISKIWGFLGVASLMAGVIFFGWVTVTSAISLPSPVTWEFIAFCIFKGLIALTFVAGIAKYAFLFSSSYMREALKNADRRHAINFGKFYLESYGAAAEWSQVKEAFEHWNITAENAFSKKEDTLPDVASLEKAVSLIERVSKSLPLGKN